MYSIRMTRRLTRFGPSRGRTLFLVQFAPYTFRHLYSIFHGGALRNFRPCDIRRKHDPVVARRDWLGSLIGVTRVMSELAPFSILSSVASIVLLILEPLEASNLKHSRRLSRNLAEKVVHITVGLRAEAVADESLATSPRFIQTCVEFCDCLSSVAAELRDILHRRRSWVGQYFSAHSIRSIILDAQKRVDDLMGSFMLATAVGTRLGVQSIRTDLRIMRSTLMPPSSNAGAEPKFSDFYKLIPADLQLIPPLRRVPSAELREGLIEYPVLIHGVRMTARLYRGENALERAWVLIDDGDATFSCYNHHHNLSMPFSLPPMYPHRFLPLWLLCITVLAIFWVCFENCPPPGRNKSVWSLSGSTSLLMAKSESPTPALFTPCMVTDDARAMTSLDWRLQAFSKGTDSLASLCNSALSLYSSALCSLDKDFNQYFLREVAGSDLTNNSYPIPGIKSALRGHVSNCLGESQAAGSGVTMISYPMSDTTSRIKFAGPALRLCGMIKYPTRVALRGSKAIFGLQLALCENNSRLTRAKTARK
ncbi:hypothetical protein B0H16DRAFT_1893437 [Mycena metata]|uniref:Uncharacterized protein n=1 Tax=Mycena metata TaxID=1033252 RepID=A0AAD7HY55_9AGAR|nr:hypothetical protein B0H16DRAFT_1893437 [Mycena metata]